MFGDILVIFSTEWVRPMTVIAPMDTGLWTGHCNSSNHQHHHRGPCPTNPKASCNSSWGTHGSCRWNSEGGGGCYDFDDCGNITTATACSAAEKNWAPPAHRCEISAQHPLPISAAQPYLHSDVRFSYDV